MVAGRPVEWSYRLYVAALVLSLVALPITYLAVEVPATARRRPVSRRRHRSPRRTTADRKRLPTDVGACAQGSVGGDDLRRRIGDARSASVADASRGGTRQWSAAWQRAAPWLAGLYIAGVPGDAGPVGRGHRPRRTPARPGHADHRRAARRVAAAAGRAVVDAGVPALLQAEHIVVPKVVGLREAGHPVSHRGDRRLVDRRAGDDPRPRTGPCAPLRRVDQPPAAAGRGGAVLQPGVVVRESADQPAARILLRRAGLPRRPPRTVEPRLRYAEALVAHRRSSRTPDRAQHNDLAALAAGGRSPSELRRRLARLFGEPLQEPVRLSRGGMFALAAALLLLWVPALWPAKAEQAKRVDNDRVEDGPEPGNTTFSCGAKLELIAIGTYQVNRGSGGTARANAKTTRNSPSEGPVFPPRTIMWHGRLCFGFVTCRSPPV